MTPEPDSVCKASENHRPTTQERRPAKGRPSTTPDTPPGAKHPALGKIDDAGTVGLTVCRGPA